MKPVAASVNAAFGSAEMTSTLADVAFDRATEDESTVPREDTTMLTPPQTDARTLTFSMSAVIQIVVFSLSSGAVFWASTSGMRSDIRNISTQMESAAKQTVLQQQVTDERMSNLRETVNDQKRRMELLAYEVQSLKEMWLKSQSARN